MANKFYPKGAEKIMRAAINFDSNTKLCPQGNCPTACWTISASGHRNLNVNSSTDPSNSPVFGSFDSLASSHNIGASALLAIGNFW